MNLQLITTFAALFLAACDSAAADTPAVAMSAGGGAGAGDSLPLGESAVNCKRNGIMNSDDCADYCEENFGDTRPYFASSISVDESGKTTTSISCGCGDDPQLFHCSGPGQVDDQPDQGRYSNDAPDTYDECDGVATNDKEDCADYCRKDNARWGWHWSYNSETGYVCTCDDGRTCASGAPSPTPPAPTPPAPTPSNPDDDCEGAATSDKTDCADYCKERMGSAYGWHWSYNSDQYKCTCDDGKVCVTPRQTEEVEEGSVAVSRARGLRG